MHRGFQPRVRSVTAWKGIGIAGGIIAAATAGAVGTFLNRPTGTDGIREEIREFRKETGARLDDMNRRLATVEGYLVGREKSK